MKLELKEATKDIFGLGLKVKSDEGIGMGFIEGTNGSNSLGANDGFVLGFTEEIQDGMKVGLKEGGKDTFGLGLKVESDKGIGIGFT